MKPKEWLFKNGHIEKIGRGRLSAENIALVKEAVSKGVKIEGYESVSVKPTASTEKPTAEVQRVATDPNRLIDCPDPLRDKREWTVVRKDTGKPIHAVGMANVCQGCRNSFTYCPCGTPTFLDNSGVIVVEFRQKKGDS